MKAKPNSLNPACTLCKLSEGSKLTALAGVRTDRRVDMVLLSDSPDYFANHCKKSYARDTGAMLDWLLRRMSIEPERVAYDYLIRCPSKQQKKADLCNSAYQCSEYLLHNLQKMRPKVIVSLGSAALAINGVTGKIGEWDSRWIEPANVRVREIVPRIYLTYSLQYILKYPSDTPAVFRSIFTAAEFAKMKPKLDPSVKPFAWKVF